MEEIIFLNMVLAALGGQFGSVQISFQEVLQLLQMVGTGISVGAVVVVVEELHCMLFPENILV